MGTGYNPRIVTENLVFCVDAANIRSYPKTGTTLTDISGGISGSFVNQTVFDSSNAGSLSFDGADDAVQFDSFPQLFSGSFTFSIWVYRVQSGSVRDIFFGSYNQTNNVNFEVHNSNNLRFFWNNGEKDVYSAINQSSTGWRYYTYQRERISSSSSTVRMYSNTILVKDQTFSSGFSDITTPSTFYFARDTRTNIGTPLYGKISLATIHNRALTADEIRQNYLATKERYA